MVAVVLGGGKQVKKNLALVQNGKLHRNYQGGKISVGSDEHDSIQTVPKSTQGL